MNTTIAFISGFVVAGAIALLICLATCRRGTREDTSLMDFVDSREATLLHQSSDPERDEWCVLVGKKIVSRGNDLRDVLTRAKRMTK